MKILNSELIRRLLNKKRNHIKNCKHMCLWCKYFRNCEWEECDE